MDVARHMLLYYSLMTLDSSPVMRRLIKPAVFLLCLLPLLWLLYGLISDALGANPIEVFTRSMGEWGLRFLLLTLAITPLRRLSGQPWPIRYRRMLGLFSFFYVCVHWVSYLWLDQFFDWHEILLDIVKRPFITIGMSAFALLVPLALTSNQYAIRRLGRRWKKLHRLVYVASVFGVLHYFWLVKADVFWPSVYAVILFLLFVLRLPKRA